MPTFSSQFEQLLQWLGVNAKIVAERAGVTDQTLSDWKGRERMGRTAPQVIEALAELAKEKKLGLGAAEISAFLNGTALPLTTRTNVIQGLNPRNWDDTSPRVKISTKAKGGPAVDYVREMFVDKTIPHSLFPFYDREVDAAIIEGTSMASLIDPGDIVVFDRGEDIHPVIGDLVLVELAQQEGAIAKYLEAVTEDEYKFSSHNPDFKPKILTYKKAEVLGVFPIMNVVKNLWLHRTPRWRFMK